MPTTNESWKLESYATIQPRKFVFNSRFLGKRKLNLNLMGKRKLIQGFLAPQTSTEGSVSTSLRRKFGEA